MNFNIYNIVSSYLTVTIFTTTTTVLASTPPSNLYIRSHQTPTAAALSNRSPASPYNPLSDLCGTGTSCSQACGSSFQTCPSNDSPATLHCFNPSSGQECCANGSGYACASSFYCAQTPLGQTLCCPETLSLSACADLNDTPTLETAHSTTTSTVFVPESTTRAASTVTAVQTVVVTVDTYTGSVSLASPNTITGIVNATVTRTGTGAGVGVTASANVSYVEYTPSSSGDRRKRVRKWSMLGLMIGLGML